MVYYNDNDPFSAAWLRELIKSGLIAPGVVDERSILEIKPDELEGYTQCHFFAGIGGWSAVLRLAGWSDERHCWTGSCPCQPLSCAGQRKGHADERHLWPAFYALIAQCRPATVFGEQVAGTDGREWLAGVRADLEGTGYAVGAADLCAAMCGAPHRRQRLYWVAHAGHERTGRPAGTRQAPLGRTFGDASGCGDTGGLVHANGSGPQSRRQAAEAARHGSSVEPASGAGRLEHSKSGGAESAEQSGQLPSSEPSSQVGGMGDAEANGCEGIALRADRNAPNRIAEASFWSRYDLLPCLDGKARRIEPGTFPLAHGVSARVGRLRGYGNAIVPQVAAAFIQAFDCCVTP